MSSLHIYFLGDIVNMLFVPTIVGECAMKMDEGERNSTQGEVGREEDEE